MMQMVRGIRTVLLRAGEAVLAATTHAAREADADETADADRGVAVREAGTERDDPPDAFVAADVREFDRCDGTAVRAAGCAEAGVEICSAALVRVMRGAECELESGGRWGKGVEGKEWDCTALADAAVEDFGEDFVLAWCGDGVVGVEFNRPAEAADEGYGLGFGDLYGRGLEGRVWCHLVVTINVRFDNSVIEILKTAEQ